MQPRRQRSSKADRRHGQRRGRSDAARHIGHHRRSRRWDWGIAGKHTSDIVGMRSAGSSRVRYGALCGRWRCQVADELAHRLTLGVATAGVPSPSPRQSQTSSDGIASPEQHPRVDANRPRIGHRQGSPDGADPDALHEPTARWPLRAARAARGRGEGSGTHGRVRDRRAVHESGPPGRV